MKLRFRHTFILFTIATLVASTPAFAQWRGGGPFRRSNVVFIGGYFYNPFFGPYPWWPLEAYPYGYYPAYYSDGVGIRVKVKPSDAAVYVDGYYAGIVDDFNGFFQRLRLSPGEHDLTVYLEGYRTVHQRINLSRHSSYKVNYVLETLGAGESSEKPPAVPAVPTPPPGSYVLPRTPPAGGSPAPRPSGVPAAPPVAAGATAGTIVLRVQPAGAEIVIDGERWTSSDDVRLVVQVSPGRHHVEVRKSGYRTLSTDIDVRGGSTTPLNISLVSEPGQ